MKGSKKRGGPALGINMTPMIDVVFQLIIFFITTAILQQQHLELKIEMALAPHGPVVEEQDPRTVYIDVDREGRIVVGQQAYSDGALRALLRQQVGIYGQSLPVVIRGDGRTRHEDIKRVMDACTQAGLWRVRFAAVKEAAARDPRRQ